MATEVSVCSNALLMLGAKAINSLGPASEGNADRVALAANLWPQVRDDLLRAHPWNCAVKRVVLAPEVTPPAFDYSASFIIPSDWLRTIQVGLKRIPLDFTQEGRRILCDTDALPLVYVFQNKDVGSWDGNVVEVATARMAAAMAYAVTQSSALADSWHTKAKDALKFAKATDGQDTPAETLGDYPQHQSRYR